MSTPAQHLPEVPVPGSPDQVLAAARAARRAKDAAAAAELVAAVEWAALHEPTGADDAAYWWESGEAIPLAGPGAPQTCEYAVAELAVALGVSTDAGRRLIGHALEICHRLPRLWRALQSGAVPAWRATRVADATMGLSPAAAAFVDRQVAAVAGRVSLPQLDRLVLEAKIRHEGVEREDPEDPCPTGPDTRRVDVWTDQMSFDGTVRVTGELDLVDALHLDQALSHGAEQLRLAGSPDALEARRAAALGEMSRHQLALTLESPQADEAATPVVEERARRASRHHPRPQRPVTLFVHVSEDALTGADPVGRCENTRSPVSSETIRTWCGHPDAVVTVKPIIDLDGHERVDQYELPDRLKELVDQRDGHCVFPWCTRPARRCDHDHVMPYDPADPARGPTCGCNIAPLCRGHHRLKTHTPWRYRIVEPGVYAWTTPHDYRVIVDHTGTRDVTPDGTPATPACLRRVDPPDE